MWRHYSTAFSDYNKRDGAARLGLTTINRRPICIYSMHEGATAGRLQLAVQQESGGLFLGFLTPSQGVYQSPSLETEVEEVAADAERRQGCIGF